MAFENKLTARTVTRVVLTVESILRVLAIVPPVLALPILTSSQHEAGCVDLDSKAQQLYSRIFRLLVAANVIQFSYAIILPLTVKFLIKSGSMPKRYFVTCVIDLMMFILILVAMEAFRDDYKEGLLLCHKVSVSFVVTFSSFNIYVFLLFVDTCLLLLMEEPIKEQLN